MIQIEKSAHQPSPARWSGLLDHHTSGYGDQPRDLPSICGRSFSSSYWMNQPIICRHSAQVRRHAFLGGAQTHLVDHLLVAVVDVFRPPWQAPDIAHQAVAAGATALWLQLGIASEQARAIAEGAGLLYVEDRCLIIEQRRLGLEAPGAAGHSATTTESTPP